MKKLISPLLFPLILCILLGGATFWLNRATNIQVEETQLNPTTPQYVLKGTTAQRFDENGKIQESVISDKLWQLPDGKHVFFSNPQISISENGKIRYQLSAQEGIYNIHQKTLKFTHTNHQKVQHFPTENIPSTSRVKAIIYETKH